MAWAGRCSFLCYIQLQTGGTAWRIGLFTAIINFLGKISVSNLHPEAPKLTARSPIRIGYCLLSYTRYGLLEVSNGSVVLYMQSHFIAISSSVYSPCLFFSGQVLPLWALRVKHAWNNLPPLLISVSESMNMGVSKTDCPWQGRSYLQVKHTVCAPCAPCYATYV